ncbi:hypothetical protein [Edaphobacter bradus]|uniref:hypothetical protein n=1 Tax=Edaphobacter bradus TaxID=2259016 RepID=UPI0021DF5B18|nr:hypothetical protein [Edaphobacter bradus]
MHTCQVRFDVDHPLRILRCMPPDDRIADPRYAAIHFEDSIQLLNRLRRAGLPEEIASPVNPATTWTVTFEQLSLLGYSAEQLRLIGVYA